MRAASVLRVLAAIALVVAGLVHLQLYFAGYRSFPDPNLGRSFLLKALASGALAAALLADGRRLVRWLAIVLAAASLAAFAASRTSDLLFGFRERGLSPSPQAPLAVVAELAALALLAATLHGRERDPRPRTTAPILAPVLAVGVAMAAPAALWANTSGSSRSARPAVASTTTAGSAVVDGTEPTEDGSVPATPAPTRTTVPASTTSSATGPAPTSTPATSVPATSAPATSAADPVTTPAPPSTGTPGAVVDIADFAFLPPSITVDAGATVTWVNVDAFDHSVVVRAGDDPFDSGTIEPGGAVTHAFGGPGEYAYICGIHPYMAGTVVVPTS